MLNHLKKTLTSVYKGCVSGQESFIVLFILSLHLQLRSIIHQGKKQGQKEAYQIPHKLSRMSSSE